jgi:hypothetical protein
MFTGGGFCDPILPSVDYDVVEIPNNIMPDFRLERCDLTSLTKRRLATPSEITEYDDTQKSSRADSIDRDLLIQAIAQLDYEERQKLQVKASQTLLTPAQCKARVRAIYLSLL